MSYIFLYQLLMAIPGTVSSLINLNSRWGREKKRSTTTVHTEISIQSLLLSADGTKKILLMEDRCA